MIIQYLAKNQNWAKITPFVGVIALVSLFYIFSVNNVYFWALINIPLYLFHQTEEHFIPGGFKDFINKNVIHADSTHEVLTDIKVFWINVLMVWLAFAIFGALSFVNIGFGLVIIVFSMMNCLTHIIQWIKLKCWNPGLVMASIQFIISIYASYFISTHGLSYVFFWWFATILFSIIAHILLFKLVMSKNY